MSRLRAFSLGILWRVPGRWMLAFTVAGLATACSDSGPAGSEPTDSSQAEALAPGSMAGVDLRPNLVVVCIDTLRADHTSLYGGRRPTTPQLERIGRQGFVARCFFANAPWTKPSVASYFTGLHPSAHGSLCGQFGGDAGKIREVDVLAPQHRTLAEALRAAGYRTAAHISNDNLAPKFGYDQGFDEYRFVPRAPGGHAEIDREGVEQALQRLVEREEGEAPRFVWLHLMSVHQYVASAEVEPFRSTTSTPIPRQARQAGRVQRYADLEAAVDAYDTSVRYADALVGRLFDGILAQAPNTVLVILADHGEEFLEHGGFEHGATLFREQLAVPFVAHGPGVPVEDSQELADSLDLFPTLAALAGLPPGGGPGRALFGPSGAGPARTHSMAEQHHRTPMRRYSLIWDDAKLIEEVHKTTGARSLRVFVDALHGETALAPRHVDESQLALQRRALDELRGQAEKHLKDTVGEVERVRLDADEIERLRALGYIRDKD